MAEPDVIELEPEDDAEAALDAALTERSEKPAADQGRKDRLVGDKDFEKFAQDARDAQARAKEFEDANRVVTKERDELATKYTTAVEQQIAAEERAVAEGLAAANAEADRLEDESARLSEEGKFKEAAKAARLAAQAGIRADQFTEYGKRLGETKKQAQAQAEAQRKGQEQLDNLPPLTRNWINAHPRYMTDMAYQQRVIGAAMMAQGEGLTAHSQEWLSRIEETVGEKKGSPKNGNGSGNGHERIEPDDDDSGAVDDEVYEDLTPQAPPRRQQQSQSRRQTQDIPVTRRAPGREAPVNDGRIRLTPEEVEHAEASMTLTERTNPDKRMAALRSYASERDRIRKEERA